MKKSLAGIFLATCLISTGATGASAADITEDTEFVPELSGWYLAVSGGLNKVFEQDFETDGGPAPFTVDADIDFDYGWRAGAAIGKRFGSNFRGEVEFAYSSTDADDVAGVGVGGSLNIFSVLAKIDFEMEFFGWWHPYLGVGAGAAHVNIDDIGLAADPADGSDTVFAAAVEGGSMFELSDTVELFTQTQLVFLGDVDGGFNISTASITLEDPLVLSSSIGLRIKF